MPPASIIINTYNRPEPLSRCLEALSRQPEINGVESIVVDDGSRGDFKAIHRLWKRKMPGLQYVKIRHAGRSAARNRGARMATGDRLIFLGDDVLVRPGWLTRHLKPGTGGREVAILGPYPLESALQYPQALRHYVDSVHLDRISNPDDVDFPFFVTGNLSMDRAFFLELGGFDERFVHYGWEDIDLGYRFKKAGGRIVFDDKARAVHAHPKMTRGDLWRREFQSGITARQFWDKWQNEDIQFMRFWANGQGAGPVWRRALGRALVEVIERVAPNSGFLAPLYERLVYSYRLAGVEDAQRLHSGEVSGEGS